MFEYQNPEYIPPTELQQPPVFTDAEASAVLQAQAEIAGTRSEGDGNAVFREYVMGATYDGTIVSVDERSGLTDDHFIVRVGSVAQLTQGTPISEQKMAYGTKDVIRFRDGGTTILRTQFGTVSKAAPQKNKLPELDGKVLFPMGEDGQPFSPAAKREAEAAAASAEAKKVSVGGIRRFLRRLK